MATVDKTQFPQPVGISSALPTRYPVMPEKLVKAFPDFVSYHQENERLYKALRQAWVDSSDDLVMSINRGDVGLSGNIRAAQNDLIAQIRTERTARIDGDAALAIAIDAITTSAGTTSTIFVQSSTPVALRTNDIWIDPSNGFRMKYWNGSAWTDMTDQRLFDTIAAVTTESITRASADSAMATQITSLLATTATNTANIVTILSTYATQTFATAKKTEAITASAIYTDGAVSAASTTITTAYVAADLALSDRIDLIVASVGNHIFVQTTAPTATGPFDIWFDSDDGLKEYYWNGTTWTDATDARLPIVIAAVATESSARATADTALASSITTLTASVAGNAASITTESSARATADGFLSAKYTLTAVTGDIITGLNITSSTGGGTNISAVSFQADRFQINTATGGNKQIFSATSTAVKLGDVLTVNLASQKVYIGTGTYANSNTGFYVDATGQFSLKDKLTWDGTNLSINGSGTFSGALSGASGTFTGALSGATGTFTGALSGATGSFTGALTSTSGTIGGFTIGATRLSGTLINLDTSGCVSLIGSNTATTIPGTTEFTQLVNGDLTMSAGNFPSSGPIGSLRRVGLHKIELIGWQLGNPTLVSSFNDSVVIAADTGGTGLSSLTVSPSGISANGSVGITGGLTVSSTLDANGALNVASTLTANGAMNVNGGHLSLNGSAHNFIIADGAIVNGRAEGWSSFLFDDTYFIQFKWDGSNLFARIDGNTGPGTVIQLS